MSIAALTLQFKVDGTETSIAKVNAFRSAVSDAADGVNSKWLTPLSALDNALEGIGSKLEGTFKTGLLAGAAAIGGLTFALSALVKGFVDVNQKFNEFEISLASSLKSSENAKKIVAEVAQITATSPVPFKDLSQAVTGLSVLPQLRQQFSDSAENNTLGDSNAILKKSISLIEAMTTFRPDKTADDAVFSIREALTGQFRSLQRRFDVPISLLTDASGKSVKQLNQEGPNAILDSLSKAFANIISPEAVHQRSQQVSVAIDNLYEELFQMPVLAIGKAGVNGTISDKLNGWLKAATNFFSINPGNGAPGAFTSGGFANRLSLSINKVIDTIADKISSLSENLLSHFGFGADKGGSFLERATNAITTGVEKFADELPSIIDGAVSVGKKVAQLLEDFAMGLASVVKWFVNISQELGPVQTALLAFFGPKLAGSAIEGALRAPGKLIASAGKETFARAAQPTLDNVTNLAQAAKLAEADAKMAKNALNVATNTGLVVDEISPMASAFRLLSKEADAAAGSLKNTTIRATEEIANALAISGITSKAGNAIRPGQIISQSILEAGAASAGTKYREASNAIKMEAEYAAEVAAVVAAQKAELAEAASAAAAGEAFAAAAITIGTVALALAAVAGAAYQVKNAFDAYLEARDAEKVAIESSAAAQTTFANIASKAIEKIRLAGTAPEKQIANAADTRFKEEALTTESLKHVNPGDGEQTDLLLTRLSKLLDGTPGVKLSQVPEDSSPVIPGIPHNNRTNWILDLGNQKITFQKDSVDDFVTQLLAVSTKQLQTTIAPIYKKDPGLSGRAAELNKRSIDALRDTNSPGNTENALGFGTTQSNFDPTKISSVHSVEFGALSTSLETSVDATDKYADYLKDFYASYAQGVQNAQNELDKQGLTLDSSGKIDATKLLQLRGDVTDRINGWLSDLQSQLASGAKELTVDGQKFNADDIKKRVDELTALRDQVAKSQDDFLTKYTNGYNALLHANRSTGLKNSVVADSTFFDKFAKESSTNVSGGAQEQFDYAQATKDVGNTFNDPTSLYDDPAYKAAAQKSIDLLDKSNQVDTTYAIGLDKYNKTIDKADFLTEAYQSQVDNLTKVQSELAASGVDDANVNNALKDARKGLTNATDQQKKAIDAENEYIKSLTLARAHDQAALQLEALQLARAKGGGVSTASLQAAEQQEALSRQPKTLGEIGGSFSAGFKSQFVQGDDYKNMADVGVKSAQAISGAFNNAFGSLVNGTANAKDAFRQMTISILQDISKMLAEKAFAQLIGVALQAAGSLGSASSSISASGSGELQALGSDPNAFGSYGNSQFGDAGTQIQNVAADGWYVDQGSGIKDDVPVMVMKGEYILNKKAVSRIGKENLDKWNDGNHVPRGFADGGMVGDMNGPNLFTPVAPTQQSASVNTAPQVSIKLDYHAGSNNSQSGPTKSNAQDQADHQELARSLEATIMQTCDKWDRRRRIQNQNRS